jgi:hypothetical protein
VRGSDADHTVVTTTAGDWTGSPTVYAYVWQRDSGSGFATIPGATGHTYVPAAADGGALVRSQVTASSPDGVVSVRRAPGRSSSRAGPRA